MLSRSTLRFNAQQIYMRDDTLSGPTEEVPGSIPSNTILKNIFHNQFQSGCSGQGPVSLVLINIQEIFCLRPGVWCLYLVHPYIIKSYIYTPLVKVNRKYFRARQVIFIDIKQTIAWPQSIPKHPFLVSEPSKSFGAPTGCYMSYTYISL